MDRKLILQLVTVAMTTGGALAGYQGRLRGCPAARSACLPGPGAGRTGRFACVFVSFQGARNLWAVHYYSNEAAAATKGGS